MNVPDSFVEQAQGCKNLGSGETRVGLIGKARSYNLERFQIT